MSKFSDPLKLGQRRCAMLMKLQDELMALPDDHPAFKFVESIPEAMVMEFMGIWARKKNADDPETDKFITLLLMVGEARGFVKSFIGGK